jgi:FtsH-binding integral membrane protein
MAQPDNRYAQSVAAARAGVAVDQGLRAYMLGVYNYMAAGVALTGIIAYLTNLLAGTSIHDLTPFGQMLYTSPLHLVVMLAPIGFVLYLSFRIQQMSVGAAQLAFWLFAAVMGLSLSWIFLVYAGASIAQVFFITAATFGALSLWGYTTRRDISGWGSFLFMGLVGIIIAMIVNWFLASPGLLWAISVIGVLVFAGLTAYDTQRIKDGYVMVRHDTAMVAKSAIMGALSLYLDFINLFIMLLNLMGSSRE